MSGVELIEVLTHLIVYLRTESVEASSVADSDTGELEYCLVALLVCLVDRRERRVDSETICLDRGGKGDTFTNVLGTFLHGEEMLKDLRALVASALDEDIIARRKASSCQQSFSRKLLNPASS